MKQKLTSLLKYLVVLICLGFVAKTIIDLGPRDVLQAALNANPWWLLLAVLPLFGRFAAWSIKWYNMLARQEALPFGLVTRLVLAGSFINMITPTAKLGGGVLRAYVIHKKKGWTIVRAYGWVMADQVSNFLGNVMLFGSVLLGSYFISPLPDYDNFFLVGGSLAWVLVLAWISLRPGIWRWSQKESTRALFRKRVPKRFRRGKQGQKLGWSKPLFEPLLAIGNRWQILSNDLFLTALSFGLFCWSNAMVLRALGIDESLVTIALVVLLGYLIGSVVGVMGGIGVTELFMIKLYTAVGIPGEIAAAGALLHRALFYIVNLVFGGISVYSEGWKTLSKAAHVRDEITEETQAETPA